MRLREMQKIISQANIEEGRLVPGQSGISNINNFKKLLSIVGNMPIFDDEIKYIYESPLYATSSDSMQISSDSVRREIFICANHIYFSTISLVRLFDNMIDELNDETISIKIRESSDFDIIIKDLEKIQSCISQIITHPEIGGRLELNSWEYGSKWMNLYLGSILAVSIVASAAWSGAVVNKKIQEGRILSEYARGLSINNEALEEIRIKQEEAITLLINEEAKRIQVEFYNNDNNNEELERLKYSIKMFSELIENGTEVHPALTAPETVQNLFPDFAKLDTITSKIKLLSAK